jgi:hypothetical protein
MSPNFLSPKRLDSGDTFFFGKNSAACKLVTIGQPRDHVACRILKPDSGISERGPNAFFTHAYGAEHHLPILGGLIKSGHDALFRQI